MSYVHRATGDSWSDTYRDRHISAHRSDRVWRVVVDRAPQPGMEFDTFDEAAAWLRRRVDEIIAEQIFPGLSAARNFAAAEVADSRGAGGGARR